MSGDLAARQAALVAALVAGGPPPPGFDRDRLTAAAAALLRKRAGVVAAAWPMLAAGCADLPRGWPGSFTEWADGRPPQGGLRDGWDFARWLHRRGELPELAEAELAVREALFRYDGTSAPTRRRLPAVRRVGRVVAGGVAGRSYVWHRRGSAATV